MLAQSFNLVIGMRTQSNGIQDSGGLVGWKEMAQNSACLISHFEYLHEIVELCPCRLIKNECLHSSPFQ